MSPYSGFAARNLAGVAHGAAPAYFDPFEAALVFAVIRPPAGPHRMTSASPGIVAALTQTQGPVEFVPLGVFGRAGDEGPVMLAAPPDVPTPARSRRTGMTMAADVRHLSRVQRLARRPPERPQGGRPGAAARIPPD